MRRSSADDTEQDAILHQAACCSPTCVCAVILLCCSCVFHEVAALSAVRCAAHVKDLRPGKKVSKRAPVCGRTRGRTSPPLLPLRCCYRRWKDIISLFISGPLHDGDEEFIQTAGRSFQAAACRDLDVERDGNGCQFLLRVTLLSRIIPARSRPCARKYRRKCSLLFLGFSTYKRFAHDQMERLQALRSAERGDGASFSLLRSTRPCYETTCSPGAQGSRRGLSQADHMSTGPIPSRPRRLRKRCWRKVQQATFWPAQPKH